MLNLTDLFTALGRAGRSGYLIASGQAGQGVPFTELAGYSFVNPAWVAPLAQSYDALIRNQSQGMSAWVQAAQTILQQLVAADNPAYGISLTSSLEYLLQQMTLQAETVRGYTLTSTVTADVANVGDGVCVVTLVRGDGLTLQNTVAEESTLFITADSYTGGATAGQEPWNWVGAPNVSSLGTGTPVNTWDWDWPTGSGASAGGSAISASQDASTAGNYLTNSDFEDWSAGAAAPPDNWALSSGTWGTGIQRGATAINGDYSVQLLAGTGATPAMTQQFGSSEVTGATAGTSADPPAFATFFCNVWLRASGVVTAGTLVLELVDDTGAVILDQAGGSNSTSIDLTTVVTTWTARNAVFRLPVAVPSVVRLRLRVGTAITGNDVFVDDVCFCEPTILYPGGPRCAVFSGGTPFEAVPDPDAFTLTFTNNRGGALYGASFQTLMNRLFQFPDLILPYTTAGLETVLDSLITAP